MPHFDFSIRLPQLLAGLVLLLGIAICAVQFPARQPAAPDAVSPWQGRPLGTMPAHPLQQPLLLGEGLLWRPLDSAALHYQHLTGSPNDVHDWLGTAPERWWAALIGDEIHLVWSNDALWAARLAADGSQRSAPIQVAEVAAQQVALAALPQSQVAILWQAEGQVTVALVDRRGRPRFPVPLGLNAQHFAAWSDGTQVMLAWADEAAIYLGQLRFSDDYLAATVENVRQMAQLSLNSGESLAELQLYQVEDRIGVLWGIQQASRPDHLHYQGAQVPRNADGDPLHFTVALPDDPPLRWLRVQGGSLTLAAFLEGRWQPAIIQPGAAGALGYQVLPGAPVTASAIAYDGQSAAWLTLNEAALPQLYLSSQAAQFQASATVSTAWSPRAGLPYLPLGLVWWGVSMVLWGVFQRSAYRLPLALAAYWLAKGLVHLGLFAQYPQIAQETALLPWAAGGLVLGGISVIAVLAAGIAWQHGRLVYRYTTYCLTDIILTFAILGASVEWTRLTGG